MIGSNKVVVYQNQREKKNAINEQKAAKLLQNNGSIKIKGPKIGGCAEMIGAKIGH